MIENFQGKPISFEYPAITKETIFELKAASALCTITKSEDIITYNAYFRAGYLGTHKKIYTRLAVLNRLQELAISLNDYGLFIFDVFRTKQTQAFLFNKIRQEMKAAHPNISQKELEVQIRKFVSHPDEPTRFVYPPHNTGGAVDIALFSKATGKLLDFGSDFDQTDIISTTAFFEANYDPKYGFSKQRWYNIRKNRRLLFYCMVYHGFTNYETEWWHYDLGDCLWAANLNTNYIYDSLELQVLNHVHEHCNSK